MSYQINIFNMNINHCSRDGKINIYPKTSKNNHLTDKGNNKNSSAINIQKQ
jgi:hypothetical protein